MDNRAGEMEVFALAAEQGSFSAAGRRLGLSPSAVSKLVSRIEDRLGTRLLMRSTRALTLTAEGELYLERARRILAEIAEVERLVSSGAEAVPRGRLRVNTGVGIGVRCIVPLVPEFMELYPQVELDLSLTDSMVDLVEERADIAIRTGPMRSSTLKARKLFESPRVIVAAPAYLARHGTPQVPGDLDQHNCLRFNFRRAQDDWPFRDPMTGAVEMREVFGNFLANNGSTVRQLCLEGLGLARVGRFHVEADIRAGTLVPLLEEFNGGDIEVIHAVYVGHEHLATRIRAFIDFLAARVGKTAEISFN
ncbi:LysR family transcriptional regulator [Lacibacterium aquatile]|uniref:LysR family transcriptional regulator n=1 Tax=Lacibacterium aquatile TaxID=1168082 RepID=A0ABW5DQI3_9PROT